MARTRLAGELREAASVARESFERGVDVDHVLEERRTTRRELLRDAGALALGVGAFGRFASTARAAQPVRVVVVGAGLAGLTAAYRLRQAGCVAAVHEALAPVWADAAGRCRGDFASSQIVEHGGELIDQSHTAIRQLAESLGLDLDNLLAAEVNGTEQFNWMGGGPYSYAEATSDMKTLSGSTCTKT